ncbi:hypothetical protein SAMD00023353_0501100 [Rosellinia necatrix]|uniref:Uncharacterized protein n=1 Tax=Rosellinia necatrix TaxID=77044 RepID=A0A1S8A630_ROSNE|nr:hypothetical protein SAMD00023353_0501100 [Rosellinia necatrix]
MDDGRWTMDDGPGWSDSCLSENVMSRHLPLQPDDALILYLGTTMLVIHDLRMTGYLPPAQPHAILFWEPNKQCPEPSVAVSIPRHGG